MRAYQLVEELAASVLESEIAPKPVVELCWRVVGSRLSLKAVPDGAACREAAMTKIERSGNHEQAVRFEELVTSLHASRSIERVERVSLSVLLSPLHRRSLVALLCELSRGSRRGEDSAVVALTLASEAPNNSTLVGGRARTADQKPYMMWPSPTPAVARSLQPMSLPSDEEKLVRDVLWCMQGIDGKHCTYRSSEERFVIDRSVCVKLAQLDRVRELCELGWLYRKVSRYATAKSSSGLADAALRSALADELAEFYRLVAVLEARLARRQDPAHRLSLRRLAVWTFEPFERIKVMAALADSLDEARAKGGSVLSIVDARAKHGDPMVRALLERLTARAAEPMFAALRRWLFTGDLAVDPHREFFIYERVNEAAPIPNSTRAPRPRQSRSGSDVSSSAAFWHSRYAVRPAMVPTFVRGSEEDILVVGKGINFLKYCCPSNRQTARLEDIATKQLNDDDTLAFQYGHGDRLARLVRRVAISTNARVKAALVDDFRLLEHLRTLKACLLLMQGDFAVQLVDAIEPHLSIAADGTYLDEGRFGSRATVVRHDLWTAFDSAVRASNATTLQTLDCLRVAIVRGRDDIVLDYEPPAPVDAVIDHDALTVYRAAHAAFLRRRRVEARLNMAWRQHVTAKRANFRQSKAHVFHRTALARARIAQLVTALGAFHSSVVERHFAHLMSTLSGTAQGLDDIVQAHRTYLAAIKAKALFKPLTSRSDVHDSARVAGLLDTLLDTATAFCSLVEALVADAFSAEDDGIEAQDDKADAALLQRLDATVRNFDTASATLRSALASVSDEAALNLAYRLECSSW